MKHWIEFLEEIGRPLERMADDIKKQHATIEKMKREISKIEWEIVRSERIALEVISELYTIEEIEIAKSAADASGGLVNLMLRK